MKEKIISALNGVYDFKGLNYRTEQGDYKYVKDTEAYVDSKEFFENYMVVYVLIKMLEKDELELTFKDKESHEYKYLMKLLGERENSMKTYPNELLDRIVDEFIEQMKGGDKDGEVSLQE